MQLLQLLSSLIAIAILAFIASRLFPNNKPLGTNALFQDYARYCPDAKLGMAINAIDEYAAIIETISPAQEIGLVKQMGDQIVCRTITRQDTVNISEDGNLLTLTTNDFTQPVFLIPLSEEDMAKAKNLLSRLTSTDTEISHAI